MRTARNRIQQKRERQESNNFEEFILEVAAFPLLMIFFFVALVWAEIVFHSKQFAKLFQFQN